MRRYYERGRQPYNYRPNEQSRRDGSRDDRSHNPRKPSLIERYYREHSPDYRDYPRGRDDRGDDTTTSTREQSYHERYIRATSSAYQNLGSSSKTYSTYRDERYSTRDGNQEYSTHQDPRYRERGYLSNQYEQYKQEYSTYPDSTHHKQRDLSISSASARENTDQFVQLRGDRGCVDQWRKDNQIQRVYVQAYYMSGDRYAIGIPTVMWQEKAGILIISGNDESSKNKARELASFYNTLLRRRNLDRQNRVAIYITDKPGSERAKHEFNHYRSTGWGGTRPFVSPSFGHRILKDFFKGFVERKKAGDGKLFFSPFLAREFLGEKSSEKGRLEVPEASNIDHYLNQVGLRPRTKYAFIWSKAKHDTTAHLQHCTDVNGLKQQIQAAQRAGRHPVLVGDILPDWQPGPDTTDVIQLGQFWNDPRFPQRLKQEGRVGQLAFFRHLTTNNWDVVNIGMRSGTLEGAAYVGMSTIFMEEKGSGTCQRLEQMLPYIPNFRRVILDRPAGKYQQAYLAESLDCEVRKIETDLPEKIQEFGMAINRVLGADIPTDINRGIPEVLNALFSHFKNRYVNYIKEEISYLDNRNNNRLFSENDTDLMTKILGLTAREFRRGDPVANAGRFNWKLGNHNPSYAELFCEQYQYDIDRKIKKLIRQPSTTNSVWDRVRSKNKNYNDDDIQ